MLFLLILFTGIASGQNLGNVTPAQWAAYNGFATLTDSTNAAKAATNNMITASAVTNGLGFSPATNVFSVVTGYGTGTPYTLTATAALAHFGTTDPAVTLPTTGQWLLLARANVKYVAATFAANQTLAVKLRKTSGTAADLASAFTTNTLRIITTITDSAGQLRLPPVVYAATANDTIQLFGNLSVLPTVGTVQITEAEIVAIRLY